MPCTSQTFVHMLQGLTNASGCIECPKGYYGIAEGQALSDMACAQCPYGTFSLAKGAKNVSECDVCLVILVHFEKKPM